MSDERTFKLRQIDGARGDLYVSRVVLMATATVWALIVTVALMLAR